MKVLSDCDGTTGGSYGLACTSIWSVGHLKSALVLSLLHLETD